MTLKNNNKGSGFMQKRVTMRGYCAKIDADSLFQFSIPRVFYPLCEHNTMIPVCRYIINLKVSYSGSHRQNESRRVSIFGNMITTKDIQGFYKLKKKMYENKFHHRLQTCRRAYGVELMWT